jgi:hypothetical protein
MTKANFLRNVAIIFACLAVMTACGGGGSKQDAAQTSGEAKTETVATNETVGNQFPSNDLTAVIPKPTVGEFESTKDGSSGNIRRFVIFMTWTVDDAKSYANTLKSEGWEASLDKTYNDGSYEFEGKKDGVTVGVNNNSIQIMKPKD